MTGRGSEQRECVATVVVDTVDRKPYEMCLPVSMRMTVAAMCEPP